jgi:hypothetical protein
MSVYQQEPNRDADLGYPAGGGLPMNMVVEFPG